MKQITINYNSEEELQDYDFGLIGESEVISNVKNILSRIKGNLPFKRDRGIESKIIDAPMNIVRALLTQNIIEEIEKDEPRFIVNEVAYGGEIGVGKLNVNVKGVINL